MAKEVDPILLLINRNGLEDGTLTRNEYDVVLWGEMQRIKGTDILFNRIRLEQELKEYRLFDLGEKRAYSIPVSGIQVEDEGIRIWDITEGKPSVGGYLYNEIDRTSNPESFSAAWDLLLIKLKEKINLD